MNVLTLKHEQLVRLANHRDRLYESPHLRWLFFEITNKCNLFCRHCGSHCTAEGKSLRVEDVEATLQTIECERPMICLTGGEPMLHPDIFEIAERVHEMGFFWGMTTNATLINREDAERLKQAGMSTVSVSLDGMEQAHDLLRRRKGVWRLALNGLKVLQDVGFNPQITTVMHRENFNDLEPLYNMLCEMGITSWRLVNVEPIGRACESDHFLLTAEQFTRLISYIRDKRFDRSCPMEVTYGCSHYLGVHNERMVRDHYFFCGAGILIASIRSNGDICACLDIENRPELVQGNIRRDSFFDVWNHRFQVFRRDRTADCRRCVECPERFVCGGDSAHTWDYYRKEPLFCYQDMNLS